MTDHQTKDFEEEFFRIFQLYSNKDSFLFGKAGDGELMAIENCSLNNQEFENNSSVPQSRRDELLDSLRFKNDNFYLGIICPCCSNYDGRHQRMKDLANQDDEHLTYANIFVNSNYQLYKEKFISSYKNHDVWLVCHESSQVKDLPFKVEKFFFVKRNAWVNNYALIEEIREHTPQNKLLLFAAGPFGNILGHKIFQSNPQNRILDIGSTLNPWLKSEGFKRDYYANPNSLFGSRKCVWS